MKKIFLAALVIFNISLLTVYAADEKVVVDESFESYAIGAQPDGWQMPEDKEGGGAYGEIAEDPDDPSNKCLAFYPNENDVFFRRYFEPVGGYTTVECRARMSDSKADTHWALSISPLMNNMVYKHGFTLGTARGSSEVQNFTLDHTRWYDMKYEIDFYNQTFTYYLDGNVVYTDMPFKTPDTPSIDNVWFKLTHGISYVDDLKITTSGGIEKIYTKLDSDKYYIYKLNRKIWEANEYTLLDDFLKHLIFVEEAVVTVLDTDKETEYKGPYVKDGMFVKIESPNGSQSVEYEVKTRAWRIGRNTAWYLRNAVAFYDGSPYVMLGNERAAISGVDKSAKTFDKDGERYIPLRALCEGFGYSVDYDEQTGMISVNGISIKPSDKGYIKNGSALKQNGQCIVSEGITYIPADWAEDITGKKLIYDKQGLTVFRDTDYPCRESVKEYIIKEIIKCLTED